MSKTFVASIKDEWSGENRDVELARATTWLDQAAGTIEALEESDQVPESAVVGEVKRLKRQCVRRHLLLSARESWIKAGRALDALQEYDRGQDADLFKQLQFRHRELDAAIATKESTASSS